MKYKDPFDYPPDQRPYIRGYNAGSTDGYNAGSSDDQGANPYIELTPNSKAAKEWEQGYEDGIGDSVALYENNITWDDTPIAPPQDDLDDYFL